MQDGTRWAPTIRSYKWSYNPYMWPYTWVIGVLSPLQIVNGVLSPYLYLFFFWGTPCRKGQGGSFSCQGDHGNVYMSDPYLSINHSALNKRCGTEKENIYSYTFLLFFNLSTWLWLSWDKIQNTSSLRPCRGWLPQWWAVSFASYHL